MYLEKLKILGFKSFARPVVFDFMPGITGVVGPNGCGKSNVVDAIRWVLGEQKAGTLRSDRMENIIFNGSKIQKPMGMAEVSLIIQNTQNVLPVEYSEVVITRRLFRSGESQYLLNNNTCRLKDINDLLMDTGLTPDAYSVIELSMVESILNGKPEDRRRIFEEAVGITKYKQRRKLTLRKLDATEQDLIRLADIINEVRSKVNSLHRQVRRAERYQELAKELKVTELRVATHQYSTIYEESVPLNSNFDALSQKREGLTSQISFKEAETETLHTDLIELDEQLREIQTQLNHVNQSIRKREEEILLNRERLKSLDDNNKRILDEIKNLKQRLGYQTEQKILIENQLTNLAREMDESRQTYQQEKHSLDELEKVIIEKRNQGREIEKSVITKMQLISDKQRVLERLNTQLAHVKERDVNLSGEKQALSQKSAQDTRLNKQLHETEAQQQDQLEELVTTQAQLELESDQLQTKVEQLKATILKINHHIEAVYQRIGFLKNLLESYADYPGGVKHLIVNYGSDKGFQSTLAEVISVDEKYRKAIETALGETITSLIVTDNETAYLGVHTLKLTQEGIVTFLPINNLSPKFPLPEFGTEAGIVGRADNLVQCPDRYAGMVQVLLGSYLIVEDLSAAQKLSHHFSSQGIHLVTLSGELIYNWGGIKGGQKPLESESLIGRQDQLYQLNRQLDQLQTELNTAEKELKELETRRTEIIRQKSEAGLMIKQKQEQLSESRLGISQIEYRIAQVNERIRSIDNEQINLKTEHQALIQQQQQLEGELRQINSDHLAMSEQFEVYQNKIDDWELNRVGLSAKVNQLNLKMVELSGTERNFHREYEQTETLINDHEAMITGHEQELIKIEGQHHQLETGIEESSALVNRDYLQKEQLETRVADLAQKNKRLRDKIEEKSRMTNQLRKERETISETIHELELRKSELRINADNLYRRIFEEYDLELKRESVDKNYDVKVDETGIENLKQKIKVLGPVNLLALKEYEQEKGRLDFLEKQQHDLISAEQDLKETISHINKTAQEKFDTIFQEIRSNFIRVFKQFFPEGEADLVIVPDEDPLEATIEIKANPKGKKIESISLLSGGEKALTAISLLFGIYLVKPSPICILDEVDAPLDDNNIKRFIKTLNEFSHSTQFIIVTHNKLTMKSAHCLYGITMEESGVSKVVSVKLE